MSRSEEDKKLDMEAFDMATGDNDPHPYGFGGADGPVGNMSRPIPEPMKDEPFTSPDRSNGPSFAMPLRGREIDNGKLANPPPQDPQPPVPAGPVATPAPTQARAGGGAPTDWDATGLHNIGGDLSNRELDSAGAEQQGLQVQDNERAQKQGDQSDALIRGRNEQLRQQDAHNAALDAHQSETEQKALNRWQALEEDAANGKIDPERRHNNQSTSSKILSNIAVAFGSLGQAFGGHNYAIDNIKQAHDDDISAQQSALDSKKNMAGAAKGYYTQLRQMGMDHAAAAAGSAKLTNEQAARTAELFTNQATTADKVSAGKKLVAGLRANHGAHDLEIQQGARRAGLQARGAYGQALAAAQAQQRKQFVEDRDYGLKSRDADRADLETVGKLAGGGKDAKDSRQHMGDELLDKGVPDMEAGLAPLLRGGRPMDNIPGTSVTDRILAGIAKPNEKGNRGLFGGLANSARGADAAATDQSLAQIATGIIKAGGGRSSPESIEHQVQLLRGDGSSESLKKNIAQAMATLNAEKSTLRSEDPASFDAYAGEKQSHDDALESLKRSLK